MVRTVQHIERLVYRTAGHGNLEGRVIAFGAVEVDQFPQADGRPRGQHQFLRPPTIQGQLHHALVIDDVAHGGALGLHHGRAGFHLDPLAYRAHLQADVDLRIAVDLQHDAGLEVGREAFLGDLDLVRSNGQIGQDIRAVWAAGDGANSSRGGLCRLDFRARHGEPGRVLHGTVNLSCGYGLRPKSGASE